MQNDMIRLLDDAQGIRLNRRRLLKSAGILGIGISATTLLAACGDDTNDDPATDDDAGAATDDEPDDTEDDVADEPDEEVDEPADTEDEDDEPADDEADEPADGDTTRGGTLTIGLNSDLTTMDPHMSTAAVDRQVYQQIFAKLVDLNENMEVIPYLVADWEISDEGTEYTFSLQEGVVFHDGSPLTAEAVQINFDRMLDPDFGSPRRSELQGVQEVEVVDDATVILHLEQAFAPLLATLTFNAGMIISPQAIEELGDDVARQPVGAGPFQFVEWATDNHLTLERFDDFWEPDLPYLDQVIFRPITDSSVRLTSLQSGEIDLMDAIAARDIQTAQNDPDLEYSEVPGLGFTYIELNVGVEPFTDRALRQAVAWCIDREAINETLFFGTGAPAQTPIAPSSWAHNPDLQMYWQDYDMARQKLEEGGMPDGFEFTMMVTNAPDAIQLGEAYQAQLGEVGIIAELELLEFGTLLDREMSGDFQAVSLSLTPRPDPDGSVYGYFHTDGGMNANPYSNEEVDRLLEEARAVDDLDERRELYDQAMRLGLEDSFMVFVRHAPDITVFRPSVQGFVHVPDGRIRAVTMWVEDE